MKSIDIKSLLIGILGTALVMMLMGQTRFNTGRFQTACASQWCIFYDTETGIGNLINVNGKIDKYPHYKVVYNP